MSAPQIKNLAPFGRRTVIQTNPRNTAEWVVLCDFLPWTFDAARDALLPYVHWSAESSPRLKPSPCISVP